MVTPVHNGGFLAVSAHNCNWIWKLSAHLLQAYGYGVPERFYQVLVHYELTSWRQMEIMGPLHSSATVPLKKIPESIEFLWAGNFTADPGGRAV